MSDATGALASPSDEAGAAGRLAAGFTALVVLTFGLIVLGALVRANDAGLACPDWPLCFGELVPRMDLRVGFEWTHRVVAGTVGLGFAALAVLALRRPGTREACAPLLGVAAALLGVQILLGALTVWHLLASWTVTSHLLTGNAFAAALLWVALTLRERTSGAPLGPPAPGPARATLCVAAGLLVFQMLLGGLVASRYAGLACPEFPTCRDGVWLPSFEGAMGLQLLHRLNGVALLLGLAVTAVTARRAGSRLRRLVTLALLLALAQLCVGAANVLLGLPVEVTGLHSALAAGLVLTLTAALRASWSRPAPGAQAGPS